MVIANESRVAKSRVVTTFNKAHQVLFNLAIRCPHMAAPSHITKHALFLCLSQCSPKASSHAASTFNKAPANLSILAMRHPCCPFQCNACAKRSPGHVLQGSRNLQQRRGHLLTTLEKWRENFCVCCLLLRS